MTVTETKPEVAEAPSEPARPAESQPLAPPPRPEPAGLAAWIGTGDHKKIGRVYVGFALVYLLAALIMGVLLSAEQVDQGGLDIFTADTYFQALTLNGHGLVVLAVLPLLLGLAIHVVPLQVGARTVAFPRAAAASMWAYIVGGGLFVASYGINGGPGGGEAQGVDLWVVSYGLVVMALLTGTVCVVTTVLTLRTPGMHLDRVPIFSWSMLVAGALWLLTLPVMLAALTLIYVDHRYGRVALGGNYELYPWIHWLIRQPQVLLYAIPALGIIGEIVPVMAGRRQRAHRGVMTLVGVAGVLGFGAYTIGIWRALAVDLYAGIADVGIYDQWVFVAMLLVAPLPILALLGGWTETLVRGTRFKPSAPLVYALAAGLLVLVGLLAAAVSVFDGLDLLESSWPSGVTNLVLAGTVLAGLGGVHYWSVKVWGRAIPDGAGYLVALLGLLGGLLAGAGELIAGAYDKPDVVLVAANPDTAPFLGVLEVRDAVETANVVSVVGWGLLLVGFVIFALSFVGAVVARRAETPADPWDGHTLEWATSSPPTAGNFDEVALVTSAAPLLDEREMATGGAS